MTCAYDKNEQPFSIKTSCTADSKSDLERSVRDSQNHPVCARKPSSFWSVSAGALLEIRDSIAEESECVNALLRANFCQESGPYLVSPEPRNEPDPVTELVTDLDQEIAFFEYQKMVSKNASKLLFCIARPLGK